MNRLQHRVRAAERATNEMLPVPGEKLKYRLNLCRAINDAHTEIY